MVIFSSLCFGRPVGPSASTSTGGNPPSGRGSSPQNRPIAICPAFIAVARIGICVAEDVATVSLRLAGYRRRWGLGNARRSAAAHDGSYSKELCKSLADPYHIRFDQAKRVDDTGHLRVGDAEACRANKAAERHGAERNRRISFEPGARSLLCARCGSCSHSGDCANEAIRMPTMLVRTPRRGERRCPTACEVKHPP